MRKIYLFDIGLLVLAGTIAVVLQGESVHRAKLSTADVSAECVTIPKQWTGVRDVQDQNKLCVIYPKDKSGLE